MVKVKKHIEGVIILIDKIEVALIDNNKLYLEGMKQIINSNPNFLLIAEGGSKDDVLNIIRKNEPDIVIVDACLIDRLALLELKNSLRTMPHIKMVLLESEEFSKSYFMKAVNSGVKGFILKSITDDLFIEALKKVYTKEYWVDPHVSVYLMQEYQLLTNKHMTEERNKQIEIHKPAHILTDKEYEVLELLAAGYGNKDIMEEMNIKGSTVKTHIGNILDKLYVNNRTNAILLAIQNGWVTVDYKNSSVHQEYQLV